MINLINAFQTLHLPKPIDAEKLSDFIQERRLTPTFPDRYFRAKETGLSRAVQLTPDRHIFVHLNHANDPIFSDKEGRTLRLAIDADGGVPYLSISAAKLLPGEMTPAQYELSMLKRVKGLAGWVQLVWSTMYWNKKGMIKRNLLVEYCNGGNLFTAILANRGWEYKERQLTPIPRQAITVEETKLIFEQLVMALAQFHEAGCVHGDIKPDNICLIRDEDGKIVGIRIIDFGRSFYKSETMARRPDIHFTIAYCPPEYLHTPANETSSEHDMWSLGGTLYNLLGIEDPSLPFCDFFINIETAKQKLRQLFLENYNAPLPKGPVTLRYIAARLIRTDPKERLSAEDIQTNWLPLIEWTTEPSEDHATKS